jgi:hypothetical protein
MGAFGMKLRKRTFPILLIGVVGAFGPATAMTAMGQTIVVTAKSVKDLANDLQYVLESAVPEGMDVGAAVDGLKQLQAGELVKGLDQSRGFGLAVTLPKDFPQGGPPSVVAAVPVTEFGQFLDSLKGLGLVVDDQPGVDGFSHKVSGPNNNPTLFVLQSKGYAIFSLIPDGAEKLRDLDPASWKSKARSGVLLSARARLADIPQALKDQFLDQLDAQARLLNDRQPGEDEAIYRGRLAGQNFAIETFKSLVRDGDAIAMDLDLDRKTSELGLDLSITARPGTGMARSLQAFHGRRSRYQSLGRDPALAFWATFPMAKELRDAVSDGFDPLLKGDLPGFTAPAHQKLFKRFLELMKSNVSAPELDYGLALQRSTPEGGRAGRYLLLFGMTVQDGRAFDRLFRDVVAEVKPDNGFKVAFDAARAADGTAIHQMTGPDDVKNDGDANILRLFGKVSVAFAFRTDAILVAFGEDSLASIRTAVDGLSAPRRPASGAEEPIALVGRLSRLSDFPDEEKDREQFRRAAAEAFRGEDARHDRISLALKAEGDGIRLRLSVGVPALKFMAAMGHAMKD